MKFAEDEINEIFSDFDRLDDLILDTNEETDSKYKKNQKRHYNIVRKSVLKEKTVCTGFKGFIIDLTNLKSLCEELFNENIIEYFLSYKISQDLIETFFSLIRRMNGWAFNPNSIQFQSAYKKLSLHNMKFSISPSANCFPQDDTSLISEETELKDKQESVEVEKCVPSKKKRKITRKLHPKIDFNINEHLHKNCLNIALENDISQKTRFVDDVVGHVAGFIVRKLK